VLQGRKERRRMSLLGSRRFLGDYLGTNASVGPGSQIRNGANIGSNERVVFSCRGEVLEHKFGRSSKPSPRILVVTTSKYYIVAQVLVQNQVQIVVERSFPLGAIKFISASTARDDWFSLGVGSQQEPDPLLNCVLKTEMFTQMQRVMPGGFNLKIGETIEYAKKPNKMQIVKVLKDSPSPADFYKSGAIHTQPGEPPNSVSRPTPRAKPVPPRPITRGKLIKPGGPNGRPSRITGNRTAQPRPSANASRPVPQPAAAVAAAASRPAASLPSHARQMSNNSVRAPPPPPPAPAAKPKIMAKVLYDFSGQKDNELSIKEGQTIEIVQKENNGKTEPVNLFQSTASLTGYSTQAGGSQRPPRDKHGFRRHTLRRWPRRRHRRSLRRGHLLHHQALPMELPEESQRLRNRPSSAQLPGGSLRLCSRVTRG
jgi:myosin I